MFTPGVTEIAILGGIVVLLFGGKKIPEIAKGLGKGIREFKNAKKDITSDEVEKIEEKKD